jgi:hypothetical protein
MSASVSMLACGAMIVLERYRNPDASDLFETILEQVGGEVVAEPYLAITTANADRAGELGNEQGVVPVHATATTTAATLVVAVTVHRSG